MSALAVSHCHDHGTGSEGAAHAHLALGVELADDVFNYAFEGGGLVAIVHELGSQFLVFGAAGLGKNTVVFLVLA